MALDTTGTVLTIMDGVSLLPLYSARGLSQTLTYFDGAEVQEYTVNAELVNLGLDRFRKMVSVISATDVRPPSLDLVWPGRVVTVGCAHVFNYPTVGGSPGRTPVAGSSFVEGDFTFYRPQITFMLGKPNGRFEEWEAGYSWSIPMRET